MRIRSSKDDIHRPLNTLARAGKGMASIDICYAVAAYNLVSEEHPHSYIIGIDFRTVADDVENRLREHPTTAETIAARDASRTNTARYSLGDP